MEDNKERFILMVNKHKSSWQNVSRADTEGLAPLGRSRPLRVVVNSSQVSAFQADVIDILDDVNVEKVNVPASSVPINDVVVVQAVIPNNSQGWNVAGVGSAQFLVFGRGSVVLGFEGEGSGLSVVDFCHRWSLRDDSRLSIFETEIDFTRNVLPPSTVSEMAGYSLPDFVDSLQFDVAQSAYFFAKGAKRLE